MDIYGDTCNGRRSIAQLLFLFPFFCHFSLLNSYHHHLSAPVLLLLVVVDVVQQAFLIVSNSALFLKVIEEKQHSQFVRL